MTPQEERLDDFRAWALARIRHCRAQETKFGRSWKLHPKHQAGPPQALVEAWTERRAIQTSLNFIFPGFLERHEAQLAAWEQDSATPTKGNGP